jgi:triosephosphate isomerase
MRKPFVAGNWKMYKTVAEARQLVSELVPGLEAIEGVEKVLCPPFTALMAVASLLEGTEIGLGAQNMHWEQSGAYTGEISPPMIAELCHYVIIGHSERRQFFGETDETVNVKLQTALAHGLVPIVCVGETLNEYETGRTAEVISTQIRQGFRGVQGLFELENFAPFVVAYEPVWAIGTGRPSTAAGAATVVSEVIRPVLQDMFGEPVSRVVRVLYGGSVKADNAAEFFAEPEIDGALVGGASLKVTDFTRIAQAAAR